jgi:hypothetical protein
LQPVELDRGAMRSDSRRARVLRYGSADVSDASTRIRILRAAAAPRKRLLGVFVALYSGARVAARCNYRAEACPAGRRAG